MPVNPAPYGRSQTTIFFCNVLLLWILLCMIERFCNIILASRSSTGWLPSQTVPGGPRPVYGHLAGLAAAAAASGTLGVHPRILGGWTFSCVGCLRIPIGPEGGAEVRRWGFCCPAPARGDAWCRGLGRRWTQLCPTWERRRFRCYRWRSCRRRGGDTSSCAPSLAWGLACRPSEDKCQWLKSNNK